MAELPQNFKEIEILLKGYDGYEIDWMTKAMYRQWLELAQGWWDKHYGDRECTPEHFHDLCHLTTEYFEQSIRCKEFNVLTPKMQNSFTFALITLKGKYWDDLV